MISIFYFQRMKDTGELAARDPISGGEEKQITDGEIIALAGLTLINHRGAVQRRGVGG